jgi:hypothetical protein
MRGRQQCDAQWRAQLQALLGLSSKEIGQLGGGRRKRTGIVDLAMIQSLKAIDDLERFFGGYGLVVVDECHHLPAVSFELSVRRAAVHHFVGLTQRFRHGRENRRAVTPRSSSSGGACPGRKICATGPRIPAGLDSFREQPRAIGPDDPTLVGINPVNVPHANVGGAAGSREG